jgi:maltose alpha-D-glucosyltransferase/alpha-amylase
MNGLLLSMPGTPVLYYGDEIGMGDNIFLGDRDGVRTPMQWTSDRNGGFSRADPQRLYLPPIQDPIYGFEALNVEAQAREPSSLMNWTKRLLAVRSGTQAFGRGRFTMLHPGNRKVLAYVREHGEDVLLCVFNVSRVAQPVELALEAYKGRVPVEMMGRSPFPPIGDLPYLLTLPAYGFFWFRLATDAAPPQWHAERLAVEDLPVLVLFDDWNSFFRSKVVPWRMGMAEKTRNQFERELMPRFMLRQRWYAAKGEPLERTTLVAHAMLEQGDSQWMVALFDTQGAAEPARYFAPLVIGFEDHDEERVRALVAVAVTKVRQQATMGVLADAMGDEPFCRALVAAIGSGRETPAEGGTLRFVPTDAFDAVVGNALSGATPLQRLTTSSNSISLLGDRLFLKCYRRLQAGASPELEMGRYLTDVAHYEHCVPVAGSVEFHAKDGSVWVLALLQAQVVNQGDAWNFVVDQLARLLESQRNVDTDPQTGIDAMSERMQVLARRLGELHLALARPSKLPAFKPEPIVTSDLARWAAAVRSECDRTLELLARRHADLSEPLAVLASRIAGARGELEARIAGAAKAPAGGLKTRLHGDLHLQQVLLARDDFLIIDFEGEPQRTLEERHAKHCALRDLAGMLRSFDYARQTALHQTVQGAAELERFTPIARRWESALREAFVRTYRDVAVAGGLYASATAFDAARPLLDLFELEKAFYELRYELDNRPDWVGVPLAGIAALAGITE